MKNVDDSSLDSKRSIFILLYNDLIDQYVFNISVILKSS